MLASHMELKGQTWPNVKMGEIGDVSTTFNYGLPDMMMNNLWVYDFNILQESQNDQIYGFPEQVSSDFAVSGPALSSMLIIDPQQNRENDDPNSIKITEMNQITKSKTTQKSIKGPRSKRFKRTIFQNPWNLTSTESIDLYGSIDNQGSVMSKRKLNENDVIVPTFKKQKSSNNDLNSVSVGRCNGVNSVGRWLEDVGFGRYAGVFEKHEVDEEALPLLTLDDLKEMGVLAVGTRRKLYAAICRLRGDLVIG